MISKINWGWKIVIVYSGFVMLILTLVFKASQNKIDIVTSEYYEKELAFQGQIDKENRSANLMESLQWNVRGYEVELSFPSEFRGKQIRAEVLFYRANDSEKDFTVIINPSEDGKASIRSDKFEKGVYEMMIDWSVDGVTYYNKATIRIG